MTHLTKLGIAGISVMKNYELIDHTADIGIKVYGKDLKDVFKCAALALFDIIAERKKKSQKKMLHISFNAVSLDELFINWLNELLSLSQAKGVIFTDFNVSRMTHKHIKAICIAENIKDFKVNVEVKAATYHELEVEKCESGWRAKVIFDV